VAGPFISFLSDFGGDTAPAICRGVIWSIAADARILDLNHQVRRHSIRDGAFLLSRAIGYLPVGIHLAVVDPGVGTDRRAIAILASRGDILVGPDNGLLRPAARALGGIVEARELTNTELFLPRVSGTFHGRDVFAPVAARLAGGLPFPSVGPIIDAASLVDLVLPAPVARDGGLDSAVVFIDPFGNVRVAGGRDDLERLAGPLTTGRHLRLTIRSTDHKIELTWARTFGEVPPGTTIAYDDAETAGLAIAVNQGSAAETYGLSLDDLVRLEPV
jgi:S-adenosyl-L-methionine hydrolase (adenosine-forming)